MEQFDLTFDINGTINQTIEIDHPNYSKEDIIKGLNNGSLCTTVSTDTPREILSFHGGKIERVAFVVSSASGSFAEYENFELVE